MRFLSLNPLIFFKPHLLSSFLQPPASHCQHSHLRVEVHAILHKFGCLWSCSCDPIWNLGINAKQTMGHANCSMVSPAVSSSAFLPISEGSRRGSASPLPNWITRQDLVPVSSYPRDTQCLYWWLPWSLSPGLTFIASRSTLLEKVSGPFGGREGREGNSSPLHFFNSWGLQKCLPFSSSWSLL